MPTAAPKKPEATASQFVEFQDHKNKRTFYINPALIASIEPAQKGEAAYLHTSVPGRSYLVNQSPEAVVAALRG